MQLQSYYLPCLNIYNKSAKRNMQALLRRHNRHDFSTCVTQKETQGGIFQGNLGTGFPGNPWTSAKYFAGVTPFP